MVLCAPVLGPVPPCSLRVTLEQQSSHLFRLTTQFKGDLIYNFRLLASMGAGALPTPKFVQ